LGDRTSVLAAYRVKGSGKSTYREMSMTQDEVVKRRAYMREVLISTNFNNLSDDALDSSRLANLSDDNGISYLYENESGYEFFISSSKVNEEQAQFRKVRAMMPFKYLNKRGKDFDWDIYGCETIEAKNMVNKFIVNFNDFKDKGMGLYVYSRTKGSGKTMLSCCILNELAHRFAVSVKFVSVLDLIEITKKSFKEGDAAVNEIYNATVLVIDDIGVQMSKEWVDSVLYRLINSRYNKKLVNIYTSNIKIADLKVDDRISDRIEGTSYELLLPEKSIRYMNSKSEKDELMRIVNKKEPL